MKKIAIIFIILVFGVCAFFGFKAASKILPAKEEPLTETGTLPSSISETDSPASIAQQNYLLIHVNDMTLEKPELVSVWVAFVYPSTPPQFMFLPLYPSYEKAVHKRILRNFQMDSEKRVSAGFLKQIERTFDLQITGYVLADDIGIGYSNFWLTGQDTPNLNTAVFSEDETHFIRLNGQTSYQQLCQLISANTGNSYFSAINWSQLLPDHFSTDLPFETIELTIDQIIHAPSVVQCEVLSSEYLSNGETR